MINNNYGWICPKCGMAHSPNTATCYCSAKATVYNINVTMDEIDDMQKLKKVFENFSQNNIVFGGV